MEAERCALAGTNSRSTADCAARESPAAHARSVRQRMSNMTVRVLVLLAIAVGSLLAGPRLNVPSLYAVPVLLLALFDILWSRSAEQRQLENEVALPAAPPTP